MPDYLSGGAGLFGGLTQGLQLILALRRAEEDQRLRREGLDIQRRREGREQAQFDVEQANAPYEDIQTQLNRQGVTAALPDIRREYAPPALGDTFQPLEKFQPPQFGAAPQQGGPPAPVPGLNTSHIAQVLERARRVGMHQRSTDVLGDVLNAASQRAQATQQPVAGAFPDKTGATAQLPQGFTAQPDKMFTPYQMSPRPERPDPLDNIFGPLLNNPVNAKILQKTDPITYQQFEAWKARRIGGDGGAPGGKSVDQHIQDVLSEHPSWNDQQVADEVRRRMRTP